MNASFKPRVEMLEDRQMMNAAGLDGLMQGIVSPLAARQHGEVKICKEWDANTPLVSAEVVVLASAPGAAGSQAVSGRVTGIVVDPMAPIPPEYLVLGFHPTAPTASEVKYYTITLTSARVVDAGETESPSLSAAPRDPGGLDVLKDWIKTSCWAP